MASTPHRLLALWRRLSTVPGGRRLFAMMLRRSVPYSGTVRPDVLELEPGFARVAIRDSRRVRNHLHSVHAIALANVAELASGLAMTTALGAETRGIVLRINVEYLKKARGGLVAESNCVVPKIVAETDYDVTSVVRDGSGEIVARAIVTWRLAPADARRRT